MKRYFNTCVYFYCLKYVHCRQKQSSGGEKKGMLKNFAKLAGKHLCQSLFFNKVAGLMPTTLTKKILWHKCFTMNFANFFKTHLLYRTPELAPSCRAKI